MLHMIGNAHLDPVWLWRWPEGCAEALGTCRAALDRLEENPGFVFTRGEAQIYAWVEEFDPDMFDRIRHFVAEGRWAIVNGWWVQPDCNLPSGESFIRQALYGKRYFADRFGLDVSVGYNVDSFGHAGALPMLLRHTGADSYVFLRPGPHEMTLPADLFDWRSPDGSTVAAFRIPFAYHTARKAVPLPEKIDLEIEMMRDNGTPFMCFYGVGNHGGGPTRQHIATVEERKAAGQPVLFSDPQTYFDAVAAIEKPVVATELQFHAIGCFAVASDLKAANRRAEAAVEQAEAAASLAWRYAAAPYPFQAFEAIWKRLLFNQFHDTLGGTSIESACADARAEFGAVVVDAQAILNSSARHLARTIAPVADARDATLLIMNFNPATMDALLEAEPWTDFDGTSRRQLLDEEGRPVAFDFVPPEAKTRGMQRIAFRLRVPGFGWRLLRFAIDETAGHAPPDVSEGARPVALPSAALVFETDGWRLDIDPQTGAIARLFNKAQHVDVFAGLGHRGLLVEDPTDTWSHGVDRFGFEGDDARLLSVAEEPCGSVQRAVTITSQIGASRFDTTIVLPRDGDLPVELRVRIDWHEQHRLLRIAYPLAGSRFEYETPAGWTERPDDGRETFGHRWVRVVRDAATIVVVNDAKYSYAAKDGTLYLTAVRSPVFAHHDPVVLAEGAAYRYLDQGEQIFTLRIQAGATVSRSTAMALADGLLKPPVITPHVSRGGTAPHAGQWLNATATTSAVTALKAAEDQNGLVVRAVELEGDSDHVMVDGHAVGVRPRGIVSARLGGNRLIECDGLER